MINICVAVFIPENPITRTATLPEGHLPKLLGKTVAVLPTICAGWQVGGCGPYWKLVLDCPKSPIVRSENCTPKLFVGVVAPGARVCEAVKVKVKHSSS